MSNGDYSPTQWRQILQNAHAALAANPQNARARAALQAAITAVNRDNATIAAQEQAQATQPEPGTVGSAVSGFGEGASLGLASKLGDLLPGPSNTAYLRAARMNHPAATFGGDLAGGAALGVLLSATPALQGLSPVAKGVVTGGLLGAGRGAVEAPAGARTLGAVGGGALGAGLGYVGGKAVAKIGPILATIVKNLRGVPAAAAEAGTAVPSKATQALLDRIAQPVGGPLEDIAAAARDLKAGRISPQDYSTALEMAGKQLPGPLPSVPDPVASIPAYVRNAPPTTPPPSGLLPYYPRGGAEEQALLPRPSVSPPVGNPGLPLQQLQLLLRMPPEQFEAASSMFPPEVIDQLRTLRGGLLQPALP